MPSKLKRLKAVNLLATARLSRGGARITVYRKTRVRIDGTIRVAGRLGLGSEWGDSPFFARGQLLVAKGGVLDVRGDFEVFTGLRIVVDEGGVLTLGSGFINHEVRIACFSSITIGNGVVIAEQVTIRDSDNHALAGATGPSTAPIVIGDHVWIGLRSTILKGVTIGSGSVVAAGSIVTKDVPPKSLVAGVPATVRRSDVEWS